MANPRIEELDDDVQDVTPKNDDASSESGSENGEDSGTSKDDLVGLSGGEEGSNAGGSSERAKEMDEGVATTKIGKMKNTFQVLQETNKTPQ